MHIHALSNQIDYLTPEPLRFHPVFIQYLGLILAPSLTVNDLLDMFLLP